MAAILLEETDTLVKVAMFVIVQALVYFILSNSSNVFSNNKMMKSLSFKPVRSISIRRMLAAISDIPPGGEGSPSATSSLSTTQKYNSTTAMYGVES